MTLTKALSSYWAEKGGLRSCPCCGQTMLSLWDASYKFNHNNWRVKCTSCGFTTVGKPTRVEAVEEWNTRTADPIIRELQARLELAKGALESVLGENERRFVDANKEEEYMRGIAKKALTTLSTDEWISK